MLWGMRGKILSIDSWRKAKYKPIDSHSRQIVRYCLQLARYCRQGAAFSLEMGQVQLAGFNQSQKNAHHAVENGDLQDLTLV
jgi:hypothetical protein